ncbi:RagB/SusD family nutrient uptake outer membrane protein [Flavivirga abyssicola]|uniref:RagB/SusD family nutrient uptake outer membrane protein n=1 Tax=Flavivirga abyssicola TaxID=3063533 RepID=UPI0026DFFAF4|nr:RagB/SusD family nutrient uptake outer membrane protein [Flavivirga sp. MEBiC07777]WVK12008.1 RagB/SusD family nutrient uptake outer membrane protein [Flavivirga sp. MEBiC07777]
MKTLNIKICTSILSVITLCLTSCELANDIDDFEPKFRLAAETAIRDAASAELALTGAYSATQSQGFLSGRVYSPLIPSMMSFTAANNSDATAPVENLGFSNNSPLVEGGILLTLYSSFYQQINRANWIIEKVSELSDDGFQPGRRLEIVAEAKALRAMAHFDLLRLWGQFYDINSTYGIDVRLSPAKSNEAFPRKSVAQTYEAIITDLDDVISDAPDLRAKYFVSKTLGKALKAKVLLYKGDYAEAAALANDVITNSGSNFALTSTFNELFNHSSIATLDNSEAILDIYQDASESSDLNLFWGFFFKLNSQYIDMATNGSISVNGQDIRYDGVRISTVNGFLGKNGKYANLFLGQRFDFIYYLRMAEMYLIYAESDARATNSVSSGALNALNAIRVRSGATTTGGDGFETYPASISLNQFLEAVRIEKAMELATEYGETWFDLIRYDYADGFETGFQVSDVKATATDPNKFILPIPLNSIDLNGDIIDQNPDY